MKDFTDVADTEKTRAYKACSSKEDIRQWYFKYNAQIPDSILEQLVLESTSLIDLYNTIMQKLRDEHAKDVEDRDDKKLEALEYDAREIYKKI